VRWNGGKNREIEPRAKKKEQNQALDESKSATETQSNTSGRTRIENMVVTAFHRKREKEAGIITITARPVQTLQVPDSETCGL
jgi:hypothetical protein